ncbi:GvpL/GvpF family gas vesicle protein [Allostreptomyces psammosilenae]|uniref:Gas vesicle protein n=1 Tax=Allostreptomyces psammosilenae TaxID=1892865 RepID=A0A852ZWP3_9ACTN|nr:GvpL/GvpF family gas vesicle protein [Allostreptomyces psammosilenae]NYI06107.1 hypothetical protein [Allostreptomyces psammosilenae]
MTVYLYGVIRATAHPRVGELRGVGEPPARVQVVRGGELAAVVSDVLGPVRAKRRDLLAHQEVLEALAVDEPVVPMRFGTLADSVEAVRQELLTRERELLPVLDRLTDRDEYNLKASLVEEAALRRILADDPELRRLNEATRSGRATEADRIALGEAVAARVTARERAAEEQILHRLGGVTVAGAPAPAVAGAFLNTSFLVDRADAERLRDAVDALRAELGGTVELRLSGPLPPYSFTTGHPAGEGAGAGHPAGAWAS